MRIRKAAALTLTLMSPLMLLLAALPSVASIETLDMSGGRVPQAIGDFYASRGVSFLNGEWVNVHSLPGGSGLGFGSSREPSRAHIPVSDPIVAVFTDAVDFVSLRALDAGHRGVRIEAYDAPSGGTLLGWAQAFNPEEGYGRADTLEIRAAGVRRIEIFQPGLVEDDSSGDGVLFDDLVYEIQPTRRIVDETGATVFWAPAQGPVAGYAVFSSHDHSGFDPVPDVITAAGTWWSTLAPPAGGSVAIRVAAFDAGGQLGPLSKPSAVAAFGTQEPRPDWAALPAALPLPAAATYPTPLGPAWRLATVQSLDRDRDGKEDQLIENGRRVWMVHSDRLIPGAIGEAGADGTQLLATPDLNGDGHCDHLWRGPEGLEAWLMRGPRFLERILLPESAPDARLIATADLNADGRSDLIWRRDSGAIEIWQMDGAAAQVSIPANMPAGWSLAGVPDLDGNGARDLLWVTPLGSGHVWLMPGVQHRDLPKAQGARLAGTPDLDGDGKHDLLWRRPDGALETWLMDGGSLRSSSVLPPVDPAWRFESFFDFDFDGRDDLLWRDPADVGHVWLRPGGEQVVSVPVYPELAVEADPL